jgi:hypothetical protein
VSFDRQITGSGRSVTAEGRRVERAGSHAYITSHPGPKVEVSTPYDHVGPGQEPAGSAHPPCRNGLVTAESRTPAAFARRNASRKSRCKTRSATSCRSDSRWPRPSAVPPQTDRHVAGQAALRQDRRRRREVSVFHR